MSKKPCSISFKPVGKNKPCTTVINGGLKVKKNIDAQCDLTVNKCLNVKNIVYSNTETITESGQTVSGVKSLSWINTNGTGVLSDNTKDGFYKKVIKIIDGDIIFWEEQAGLTASDGSGGDQFGFSVAMNADGTKVIISAPFNDDIDPSSGKAYIFGLSGGSWVEEAGLTASDGAGGDQFGHSVAMNSDGDKVIIGAYLYDDPNDVPNPNKGKAYIFGLSGGSWLEEAGLTASDGSGSAKFGYSVAMNANGDKVIIGAVENLFEGKAYIFGLSGGSWLEEAGLTASDPDIGDDFGWSVAMNADGDKVIIGANSKNSSEGKAYIFGLSGGSWLEEAGLTASDGAGGDEFGNSVAMNADGDKVIIGARSESNQGKAYIFGLSGGSWIEEAGLTASDGASNDEFGSSVAMNTDGDKVIIGAPLDNNPTDSGKSYIFGLSGGSWVEKAGLTASDAATNDEFGNSVAMNADGDKVIIGAKGENSDQGKSYIFGSSGFEDYTLTYNTTETLTLTNAGENACFIYNDELNKWIKLI